jgi:outer membrane protein
MCGQSLPRLIGLFLLSASVCGCQSPFEQTEAEIALRRSVDAAIDRELAGFPADMPAQRLTRPPSDVQEALAERREELDAMGPAVTDIPYGVETLGPDLLGREQQLVEVDLQSAISTAAQQNLAVQFSRLRPAISEADVTAAEAAFDWIFFGNAELTRTDQPQAVPVLMGVPLGSPNLVREQSRFETGLRRQLESGGSVTVSTDLTRFRSKSGVEFSPDPAYSAAVRLGLQQPLLRGFGSDVNRAVIYLSRNQERRTIQDLRGDLLQLVSDVEIAYWNLAFALQNVAIQQWLVDVGIEVRDVLERRREFDTKLAQYADAVAVVEQRKSNVIRAQRQLRIASDRLKRLINDDQLTIGSEALLRPTDAMVDAPIAFSLRESVLTAMDARPEIQQAILGIDDAGIRQMLADNNRLPLLNLSAEMAYFGLDDGSGGSYEELGEGDFIDYLVGINLEIPIGNRAAEAEFRRARLERSAAVIGYRQAVQDVVLDVKTALRNVVTTYELIEATRSFRVAQAENLRALLVEEETLASLTPEFLNLKFQRQDGLALARREELQALVNYNQSVADLYRAMGIGLRMNRIDLEIVDADGPEPIDDQAD